MKGTRGFTLVELMAAAMLAGAALLTALPLMLMAPVSYTHLTLPTN